MPLASAVPPPGVGIARDASGLHVTVVPSNQYAIDGRRGRDLCARETATAALFSGTFQQAAQLYRSTVGEDGALDGLLSTMADGLLGSPHPFQGAPELVSALSDADGTPGDDAIIHPFAELRQCVKEMVGFGYSLGQYTLSCWRCRAAGNENWAIVASRNSIGGEYTHEVCRTCDASRWDRPPGVREIFSLRKWPLESLQQETYRKQWYVLHRYGRLPIVPGNGEWAIFRTVPEQQGWQYAPFLWASLAAILARDAMLDASATSMNATPIHVWQGTLPTHADTRADMEVRIQGMGFQTKMVIPYAWKHEIHEPANRFHDVANGIIDRMSAKAEIGWFGNRISSSSGTAFTDAKPWFRVAAERRRALGIMLAQQKRDNGLVWWGLHNWGTRNAPVEVFDTDSPEDKSAKARALTELGAGLQTYAAGLAAHGLEADPRDIIELMQRNGRRVRRKEGGDAGKLPLGVDAVQSLVTGDEGRAGLGLGPFGDDRDDKTIAELSAAQQEAAPILPARRPRMRGAR